MVANFNAALMLSALRYFLLPPIQYADKYVFLLITFFGLIYTTSPIPSLGWTFYLHTAIDKLTLPSIHFYDYPVLKFLHLHTKFPCPVHLLVVGSNVLQHPYRKILDFLTWTALFALFSLFVFSLYNLLLTENIKTQLLHNHQLPLPFQWNF